MAYKIMTQEEFEEAIKSIDTSEYDAWYEWFIMQSPEAQKEFDRVFREKVKEYGTQDN